MDSKSSQIQQDIEVLRQLTSDNQQQQHTIARLNVLAATRLAELRNGIAIRQKDGLTAALETIRNASGQHTKDQLHALFTGATATEQVLLRIRLDAAEASSHNTKMLILAGNANALFFFCVAAMLIMHEMNKRRIAETALRHSEERFRLMVSGVRDYAILMLDPQGHVVSWNAGAERIKGYKSAEIVGQHFSVFYTPQDIEAGKPSMKLKAAEGQGAIEDEGWRVRKDGTRFWANVVITALRDKKGTLRGFGKVTRDMTERKHMEELMELRNAQLEAANKELQAFSYSVSHDLRAPLRAIDGFSLALLEDYADKLDAEGNGHLDRIRAGTARMGQLIDGMLNLARMSRAGLVRESIDLSPLAREIASELQTSEPDREAIFAIAPSLPVKGDRFLLRAVLENLMSNAWKFTSTKPKARIQLGVQVKGEETVHFVRDNGAGFDMRYVDKLFGVFQRLHRDIEFPGTGVGLATVQRIIHRHGGRIWAEGTPGEGATFYFVLGN